MRDMLTTAMQVNLALVANNQNEVVKRLAGWGAILAIPTVIFSLYGMNFEWMPELKWKAGYPHGRGRDRAGLCPCLSSLASGRMGLAVVGARRVKVATALAP